MPAPTVITDAEIGGILKNVYADVRKDVVPIITPLLAAVQKSLPGGSSGLQWGGNGVKWDVKLTRDVGMVSSSAGYFPADAVTTERQATMGVQRLYVTRQLDGLAITGTQNANAAYVSITKKAMGSIKTAIKLGMQEQLQGDGRFIKALVTTASTTNPVVSSPYGIAGSGQGGLLLDIGMVVAVLDGTTLSNALPTIKGRATITAITNSGDFSTLTFSAAVTGVAVGDALVPCTVNDTSFGSAINGLVNLTNRGNGYTALHGIDAAQYGRWDAVKMIAGTDTPDAGQITEQDINRLLMRVAARCGVDPKQKPNDFLLIGTPGLEIKLADTFTGQRRYDLGNMELKGGYKALMVCGLPWVSDGWCPAGTVYLLHLPSLTWIDGKDWGQVQYGSDNAWRPIPGRDAFETSFGFYGNFAALARHAHGSIVGYTDTERYSIAN